MKLIRGIHNLHHCHTPTVATIGNFDGLHKGHQHIISNVCQQAKAMGLVSTAITFEPLPNEYFCKKFDKALPGRIYSFRDKVIRFQSTDIEQLVCLDFNEALANMEAETFVKDILIDALHVNYLVVGDDFKFGKQRKGDFNLLQAIGNEYGMEVVSTPTIADDQNRISSSRIREALQTGNLTSANELLGTPYRINGTIKHGDKRGRTIGFPTINMKLIDNLIAKKGVYVVQVHNLSETPLYGVANLGNRPTFDGNEMRLETFIFDFDESVYGRNVEIELLHFLRAEQKFDDFNALLEQIKRDVEQAKAYLN